MNLCLNAESFNLKMSIFHSACKNLNKMSICLLEAISLTLFSCYMQCL